MRCFRWEGDNGAPCHRTSPASDLATDDIERYVGEHPLIVKDLADPLHRHQGIGVR